MEDNSPILLRLDTNGQEYRFFQFMLSLSGTFYFGEVFDPSKFEREFIEKFDFKRYNKLQTKFSLDESQVSISEISLLQTLELLTILDMLAKVLLGDAADTFKSMVLHKFPDIQTDWDIQFLKSAQTIFELYRKRFKRYPKLIELIEKITYINKL